MRRLSNHSGLSAAIIAALLAATTTASAQRTEPGDYSRPEHPAQAAAELAEAAHELRAEAQNARAWDGGDRDSWRDDRAETWRNAGYEGRESNSDRWRPRGDQRLALEALSALERQCVALRAVYATRGGRSQREQTFRQVSTTRRVALSHLDRLDASPALMARIDQFEDAYRGYRRAQRQDSRRSGERDGRGGGRTDWNDNSDAFRIPAGTRIRVRTDEEMCADSLPLTRRGDVAVLVASNLVVDGRTVAFAGARAALAPVVGDPRDVSVALIGLEIGSRMVPVSTRPLRYRARGNMVISEVNPALEPKAKGRTPFFNGRSVCFGRAEWMEFVLAESITIDEE